jgi:hypothetical protein
MISVVEHRTRDRALPYWVAVLILLVLGILSLPSIGWLLIAVALILALLGGVRSKRAVIAPIGAGLLTLVVTYVLFAPGFCTSGAASDAGAGETSCVSLAQVPLGSGQNWVPFLVLAPLLAFGAALIVRRRLPRPPLG